MIDFLGSLICKIRGHKWRRLHKSELEWTGDIAQQVERQSKRICNRCRIVRAVKARKVPA